MSKIIIHNNANGLSDYEAISMVSRVIADGKVSREGEKDFEQYCYHTAFEGKQLTYHVSSFRKKGSNTYTFKVYT
tara:strand:- start:148 stop:372 length:225 start_codon:yes stop_codon:yes gene_type:complete